MSPKEIADLHAAMLGNYRVGQKVRLLDDIVEPADDYAPGGRLARKDDILIVRRINPDFKLPISVSHEHITDSSFAVAVNEIEPAGEANNG